MYKIIIIILCLSKHGDRKKINSNSSTQKSIPRHEKKKIPQLSKQKNK